MTEIRDKNILLTGGAGFLGSQIRKELFKKNPKEIRVPRSSVTDLRVMENCREVVRGVDIVIHAAGNVGGIGYNQQHPYDIYWDNLQMGSNLLDASFREGVEKVVDIATVCAYPKFTPTPFEETELWNGYPEETNAPYGLAKRTQLVQCQALRSQFGFKSIFLIPANLYGPGDDYSPEKSHVIAATIAKIEKAKRLGEPRIMAWGSGMVTREFLYVKDAAKGIILAAENYDKPEPVNLGTGVETYIKDLIPLIAGLFRYDGEIIWNTSKPDGQPKRHLSVLKAEREFGFRAETTLKDGLTETVDDYLANLSAC